MKNSSTEVSAGSFQRGFTLLELMIVLAIIGVLSAIAIPQYSDYVLKAKLTPAFAALSTAQLKMEQYYQDNRQYGAAATACGILPATLGTVQNFTITCEIKKSNGVACDTALQCFTYKATSTGISDTAFIFTVDDAGTKATSQVPAGWTNPGGCWVRNKGGC